MPLGARASVSMAEAVARRLCLLHDGMQNRRILNTALATRGLSVAPVVTADSYVALFAMVADGGFDSIVTDTHGALFGQNPAIALLPFADPPPPNPIGVVVPSREPMSPLARVVTLAAKRLVIDKSYNTQQNLI